VRRRLRSGSSDVDTDLATYREAVRKMKALPESDPRSWTAQAALHGVNGAGFTQSRHSGGHFLSWHRAYLRSFERICQELTGDTSFGLPYWNWNQDPDIHPAFLDAASPLHHPRRRASVAGLDAVSSTALDPIFADDMFFTFIQQLEGTPHNCVHTFLGADMDDFGAALDPLFWAHHAMIDYCWAKWNIELGYDNPDEARWRDESWDHFVDGDGKPARITAGATALMPLLEYRYEGSTVGRHESTMDEELKADFATLERRLRSGAPVQVRLVDRVRIAERIEIAVDETFSRTVARPPMRLARVLEGGVARERLLVRIAFAQLPTASDFFVRVFVNLPEANGQTPTTDPHYGGSFSFFGTHIADGRHEGRNFLVDVTRAVQLLLTFGQVGIDKAISIQLVAVPAFDRFARADAKLALAGIELVAAAIGIEGAQALP